MWIGFLRAKTNHHPCIHDSSIHWDQGDVVVSHYKYRVCPFLSRLIVFLRHTTKILAKGSLPNFHCGRVVHQFFITCYCFTCRWVNHWHRQMFQVCSRCRLFWSQFFWSVYWRQVIPYLIGKKMYSLLTYYIVVAQAAGDWDVLDLGDCLRDSCVM
jgi:hypothetical protein